MHHFWKHKVFARIADFYSCEAGVDISVPDALESVPGGFRMPHVQGHIPTRSEMPKIRKQLDGLEDFCDTIGLPTWSFSRYNPFSRSNIMVKNDTVHLPDYEQSVPIADQFGRLGYDFVDCEKLADFCTDNRRALQNTLGIPEYAYKEHYFGLKHIRG